jgi:hypothetical protein
MTTEAVISLAGVITSVLASWLVARDHTHRDAVANAEWRGKISERVDAMYRIIFRTGISDGLHAGVLNQNSPITINVEAFREHPDLLGKLQQFYNAAGKSLSDLDLLVEIEKRFGDELDSFEKAHNLKPAASLAAVCYLLRPEMKLFDKYKEQHS